MKQFFRRTGTILFFFVLLNSTLFGQDLNNELEREVKQLETIIKKAKKKGIDVTKEESTLRTADIFKTFANWDEKNIDYNYELFKTLNTYKTTAREVAEDLPNFERREVISMLKEGKENLELAIAGKIHKQKITTIDWNNTHIKGSDIIQDDGRPVFLLDYTWKPKVPYLTKYHGNLDGFFMTTSNVLDENGTIKPKLINELQTKPTGRIGTAFLNHLNPPKWFKQKYPEALEGKRRYFDYDIDNPNTIELQELLLSKTVPLMKGKNYAELGYMLTNEPHWHTKEGSWDTGGVSEFTFKKFRNYLKEKHKDIATLNTIWGSDYSSFDAIQVTIPMNGNLQGTPIWYDWMRFNQVRGNEWFQSLSDIIHKYDEEANTHIKVMTHLFTENPRDMGIDLESMTEITSVIGNDAGAVYSDMWRKKVPEWKSKYSFDWRQLCISYDFMKSVSPDKIIFNSENHFISTIRFRDLYMKPDYARATFWLATTLGLNACQTWFFPRNVDGSLRKQTKGYAASVTQMPRIMNEITLTYLDMNANARGLSAIQKLRKPVRIFHSETSAINIDNHMDEVYHTYENLMFEGVAIGFVTEKILSKQNTSLWDVVVIQNTPFVTVSERNALQQYLVEGGKIIIDAKSILKDEYGRDLQPLEPANGELILSDNTTEIRTIALSKVTDKQPLILEENNENNHKACMWRYTQDENGNQLLSIVNLGNKEANLSLKLNNGNPVKIKNIIEGTDHPKDFKMKPLEVLYLEVSE
ncbi:hypothetical protein EI427_16540 [Flammeovirga pectinis]|uniref:Glycoside hydrolase family 42 N-terminal domain-containing protein n=1 Tax=Flammeovirga pectinis TaxID=2494373 RepID=A0A3Q9FNE2_9BACT|nr:beta-galactosidase [Flammeovirga pectinis]AZQ63774.1 hypothetical protein EI427_16540 [Flammeovirga pectinis]